MEAPATLPERERGREGERERGPQKPQNLGYEIAE